MFSPYQITSMAVVGGGRKGDNKAPTEGDYPSPNVSDLMRRLNLTEEEGGVVEFSDDEGDAELSMDWAVVGKVLSPLAVHVNIVRAAMKLA